MSDPIYLKKKELENNGAKLPKRSISRKIMRDILPWLEREEIIVIIGARQTGKSVLLFQLMYEHLLPKTQNLFYFNLDIPRHAQLFENPDKLIALASQTKATTYVFIDEIQRLREPGLFLKGITDLHLPLKLIVSGSSALEIKSKVHEALTGRKVVFHLTPFQLEEVAQVLFPEKSFSQVSQSEEDFSSVLNHWLCYGGYPAVVLAKEEKLKRLLLKEIFQSYVEKDIRQFLKVENIPAFRNLIKILASQIGQLVNKHELSNSLGIHKNTLEHYLFYLEQTFLIRFVFPFYKNPRKELLKTPKLYFHDLGLRNFAVDAFGELAFRPDKGVLFENMACLVFKQGSGEEAPLNYWRTKAGAEVDFVLSKNKPIPFEVKAKHLKQPTLDKSLLSFIDSYHPDKAFYLNLSFKEKRLVEKTTVEFITPQDLVKMSF